MFPLPTFRMSSRRRSRTSQYPVGMLPARYPTSAKSAVLRASTPQGVIWYPSTHSFTTFQSRLAKNTSMYDARSVWKSRKYACS
jgi:hypothetical protein